MARNPSIETRLRRHPDIRTRRAPGVLGGALAVAAAVLVGWVLLILNAQELTAEFAEMQDTAVTVNQRVGSRFGVLLGIIFLPLIAISIVVAGFRLSLRFARTDTGTPLTRAYQGAFALTAQHGEDFQRVLRSTSAEVIGTLSASGTRGNLVVEGWHAEADRVAYVGVFVFDLKTDPGWELVEFAGDDYPDFAQVFLGEAARDRRV